MQSHEIASKAFNLVVVVTLLSQAFIVPAMAMGNEPARSAKTQLSQSLSVLPRWYTAPTGEDATSDPLSPPHSDPLPDGELPIANTSDPELSSATACDDHNNCLTVWEAHTEPPPSFDSDIQGRLITGYGEIGSFLSLGPDSDSKAQCYPAVTYNSDYEEFFIVYPEGSGAGCRSEAVSLMGQRVSIITNTQTYTPTSLGVEGQNVDIAYLSSANSYLVVYDDGNNVEGIWLDGEGQPTTSSFNLTTQASLFARVTSDDEGVFVVWNQKPSGLLPPSIYGCYMEAGTSDCDISQFHLSETIYKTELPDVVYDTASDQALAVWREYNGSNYDIYGRILTTSTVPIGDTFLIGPADSASEPTVVYHAQDDVFLVAWSADGTLQGQYVSSDGLLVDLEGGFGTDIFDIGNPGYDAKRPGMAVNQATGLFLTSWMTETPGTDGDIHGHYVESVPSHDLAVLATRETETQPTVAHNPYAGQYLFAAIDNSTITPTVVVRFADVSESYLETQPVTLPLSSGTTYTQPVLAFVPEPDGANNHYALASTAIVNGNSDIHVWWLDENGQVSQTTTITGTESQTHPALFFNADAERVILAWQQGDGSAQSQIWRRVLDTTGRATSSDILVSDNAYAATHPTVTGDDKYNFIAWERSVGENNQDIAVRKIHSDGALISGQNPHILVKDNFHDQTDPVLAYSGHNHIVAWRDAIDDNIHAASINEGEYIIPDSSTRLFDATLNQCGQPAIAPRPAPGGQEIYVVASCVAKDTSTVYAHRLDTEGTPIGDDLVISHDSDQGNQFIPSLAQDISENYAFFLWADERHQDVAKKDVYGRLLALDPDLTDSSIEVLPEAQIPGNTVSVTIKIDNSEGLTDAVDTLVVTTLPTTVSNVQNVTGACAYSSSNHTVVWHTDLPDLETTVCQFKAKLPEPGVIPNDTYLTFTTRISADAVSPFTVTDNVLVTNSPHLGADLDVDKAEAVAGEVLTYTAALTNHGTLAQEVVAKLPIPAGTELITCTATPTITMSVDSDDVIRFEWGNLKHKQSAMARCWMTITAPVPDGVLITNRLTVTEHYAPRITDLVTTTVHSFVDLTTSTIWPNRTVVTPTDYITYTVAVTNSGTLTATNANFTGSIPNYTTLMTPTLVSCTHNEATDEISCPFGELRVGESAERVFSVRTDHVIPNGTPLVVDGVFSATEVVTPYATPAPTVTVISTAALELSHFWSHENYREVCHGLHYHLRLNNQEGTQHVTNAVVTMTLQVPVSTVLEATTHPYTYTPPTSRTISGSLNYVLGPSDVYTLVADVGPVWAQDESYQSVRINGDVQEYITDFTPITATFWIDSDQTEPFTETRVTVLRSICVDKCADTHYVDVGSVYTYENYITNWTTRAAEVHLRDTMPDGVELIDDGCSGIESDNGCDVGLLDPGESVSKWTEVKILPPSDKDAHIRNVSDVWYTSVPTVVHGYHNFRVRVPDFRHSWMSVTPRETPADTVVHEHLTYTLHLYNDGLIDADEAYVTMTAPLSTSMVRCPDATTTTKSAHWAVTDVEHEADPVELSCIIEVDKALDDGTVLTGSADIGSSQLAYTITRWTTATYNSLPLYDFRKEVAPVGPVQPQEAVTYTITITNIGDQNATGVVITDHVPSGSTFLSASEEKDPNGDDILTWNVGPLPAGSSTDYTFSVEAPEQGLITGMAKSFANQAFVASTQTEGWIPSTVASNAVLTITKIVTPTPEVRAGDLLTWTIFITNSSDINITDTVVYDEIPEHTTFITASSGGNEDHGAVTWPAHTLSNTTGYSYTFVVQVNSPLTDETPINNYQYGIKSCSECASSIPGDPLQTLARSVEELEVGLAASPQITLSVGERAYYTMSVTNYGGWHSDGTVVTFTVPSVITDVSCSGEGNFVGDMCRWEDAYIPAGGVTETQDFTIIVTPTLGTPDLTPVIVSDYGAKGENGPATVITSSVLTQVIVAPRIISTTSVNDLIVPGREVTFTLTVTNDGHAPLKDANVVADLPIEVTNWDWIDSVGIKDLKSNDSRTWIINGDVVDDDLEDNRPLPHTFTLSGTNLPAAMPITVTGYITNIPDLTRSYLELVSPHALYPSSNTYTLTLSYRATLSNSGSTTATNTLVKFTAPIPDGVQYITDSIQGLGGWNVVQQMDGFTATGGSIPQDTTTIFTFSVQFAVLKHTVTSPMYEKYVVPIELHANADRHLAPLPMIANTSYVHDTAYRPNLCALSMRNQSANTNYEVFEQVFGLQQTYGDDARHIYEQLFETLPVSGTCDGMTIVSGRHFAGDGRSTPEFGKLPETGCALSELDELLATAVKWQGAQLASNIINSKNAHKEKAVEFVHTLAQRLGDGEGRRWYGNSIILALDQNMLSCAGDVIPVAHTVFPYRVITDEHKAYIYVYDSNYPPNEPDKVLDRYITVDLETGWWYYSFGEGSDELWRGTYFRYAKLNDYRVYLELPIDLLAENILASGAMRGCWSDNGSIECDNDMLNIGIEGATRYVPAQGLESGSQTIFLLPEDDYEFNALISTPLETNYLSVFGPRTSMVFESRMKELTSKFKDDLFAITRYKDDPYNFADDFNASVYRHSVSNMYTYTMNYDLVATSFDKNDTISLTTQSSLEESDQFEMILPKATSSVTYSLVASWNQLVGETVNEKGAVTFTNQVISPTDRHVLFVYDREVMTASVICIDEGNDGNFDTCMNLSAEAVPPASRRAKEGEIYRYGSITYTVALSNTAESAMQGQAAVYASVPTLTTYISDSLSCKPDGCLTSIDNLTQTRVLTATIDDLAAHTALELQFTAQVTGPVGSDIWMHSWSEANGQSVYTTPLHHKTENRDPITPHNPTPVTYTTQVPVTQTLGWHSGDPDNDLVTYTVHWRRECDDEWTVTTTTSTLSSIAITSPEFITSTRYLWYVEAFDGMDYATGPTWEFVTVNRPPTTPTNISPRTGAAGVPLTQTLTWLGGDSDDEYNACRSLVYSIAIGTEVTPTIVETSTVSMFDPDLSPHTRYYWRVIASDGFTETVSDTWVFTTVNEPPVLSNYDPPSGTVDYPNNRNLCWHASDTDGDPLTHTLTFSTSQPLPAVYTDTTDADAPLCFEPGGMPTLTQHFWQVFVTDGISTTPSKIMSFTTDAENYPPYTPTVIMPSNGAYEVPLDQQLGWQSGDPLNDLVTYTVTLERRYPPAWVKTYITTAETITPTGLTSGTTYIWHVSASDGVNDPVQSETWRFNTINDGPSILTTTPEHQATGIPITQTLTWESEDANSLGNPLVYTVTFDQDDASTPLCSSISMTNCNPGQLITYTTYTWKVTVSDYISTFTTSPLTFTTVATWEINHAPYTPTHYVPANGAIGVPAAQDFSWESGDQDKDDVLYTLELKAIDPPAGSAIFTTTSTPDRYNQFYSVTMSLDPGELHGHTAYSWFVVADDGISTSVGSTSFFTTENRDPDLPYNPDPGDDAVQIPLDQVLRWDGGDDDINDTPVYTVAIWGDNGSHITETVNQPIYTPTTPFSRATNYTWRVTSSDGISTTPGGLWHFMTVNRAPTPPYNLNPIDGETDVPTDTIITWENGDPDRQPVTYTVVLDPNMLPVIMAGDVTTETFDPGLLLPHTLYVGVISATDGYTTSSTTWEFTTGNNTPEVPHSPNPGVDAPDVPLTQTLTWEGKDGDANEPNLHYIVAFGETCPPPVVGTVYTHTYDPGYQFTTGTHYCWAITSTDGVSVIPGPTWEFTTTETPLPNKSPYTPTNPLPVHEATDVPLTTTLTWEGRDPNKDRVTYTVLFSDTTQLLDSDTVVADSDAPLSYDPGQLNTDKDYWWQIIASDGAYTTTGPVWKFTTTETEQINLPAHIPEAPTPDDGSIDVPITQSLRWQGGDPNKDIVTYTITWWYDNTPAKDDTTTETVYYPGKWLTETTYTWTVTAYDGISTTMGPEWTFTTSPSLNNLCPNVPELIAPEKEESGVATVYTFRWRGGDVDGDPVHYDLVVDTQSDPPTVTESMREYDTLDGLDPGKRYYWWVMASDGECQKSSAEQNFSTVNRKPEPISGLVPANGKTGVSQNPTLQWQSSDPDGTELRYDVAFGTTKTLPIVLTDTQSSSFEPGPLDPHTTYYWIVTATDGISVTESNIISFTTLNHKPSIDVMDPDDGETDVPLSQYLRWRGQDVDEDALTYTLHLTSSDGVTTYTTSSESYAPALTVSTTYTWFLSVTDGFTEARTSDHHFTTTSEANNPPHLYYLWPMEDEVTNVPIKLPLRWAGGDPEQDVLTYHLKLNNGHTSVTRTTTAMSYTAALTYNHRYTWSVKVTDGLVWKEGPTWTFTTARSSDPIPNFRPRLYYLEPAQGTSNVPIDQHLWWIAGDANGDTLTSTLTVSDGVTVTNIQTTAKAYSPVLTYSTRYTWGLHVTDGMSSVVTSTLVFTTADRPNPVNHAPTLHYIEPDDGDQNVPIMTTLEWQREDLDGDWPLTSTVTVWQAGQVVTHTPITGTQLTVVLTYSTEYTWQVTVTDDVTDTPGDVMSFTTEMCEDAPVLRVTPQSLLFTGVVGDVAPPTQYISITNAGSGTLDWQATITSTSPILLPELHISPTEEIAPATIAVSLTTSTLSEGIYTGTITVTGGDTTQDSPQSVSVTLRLTSSGSPTIYLPLIMKNWRSNWEVEPNDTPQDAKARNTIVCGKTYYGVGGPDDPDDYFHFVMPADHAIHIFLDVPTDEDPNQDYDLYLYDNEYEQGHLAYSPGPEGQDEEISMSESSAGEYYIRVFYVSGSGTDPYALTVECTD